MPGASLPPPSPNPRSRDHIFVSYSSKDRGFVDRLAEDLRSRGHTVWIDFEGIRGGEEWKQSIADGIYASAVVLVVLSPDSVVSEWVEAELRTARDQKKTILPLLLRPLTGIDIAHPTIQYVYREVHYRDFTGGYQRPFEQLLADLPRPRSGVAGHCQKLAARLAALPWGLDHYIQEEARLLPLHASPYEDGAIRGQPENLMQRLRQSHRLLVLGEPGTGKTVALERLAWELATGDPLVVPVIIRLFEYDGQPLLEWVRLRLVEWGEIRLESVEETRQFLRDVPFDCYFLLDGLNEVRPAHHESVTGEIARLALEFARHRLAVTSRVQDDGWRVLRQGSAVQESYLVQPIRPEQAQAYLAAHLGAESGRALWDQLDDRMRELAATPLLLWLIKEAWQEACERHGAETARMPDNRGALYGSFVGRMLRRDDDRRLNQSVPEDRRLAALERLALVMHKEKTLAVSRERALEQIGDQAILDALLVNGLLLAAGEQLRFAPHQTLQEHFAARALKQSVMDKAQAKALARMVGRLRRGVLDYAHDPWWAETFIQLAGMTDDPNALAQTLAEINPWLAWWCVQEGRIVHPETEEAIRTQSEALVHSANVADRRRAAQALARLQTARVLAHLAQLSLDADAATARTALLALFNLGEAGERVFEHIFVSDFVRKQPKERAAWGRRIADVDPRPGVLAPGNLPDIVWCEVPGGPFQMGGDLAAYNDWLGAEFVLPYMFWIAKYPVTYAQYEPFVAETGHRPDFWNEPKWRIGNHPVIGVTWYEAYAYAKWLDELRQENKLRFPEEMPANSVIRLARECEWEKAARYPDGRLFPWGNGWDLAWLNQGGSSIDRTSAVGIFPDGANPAHGACDLSGNVWEWCLTKWADEYRTPKTEDNAAEGDDRRCVRGGSWSHPDFYARAATRNGAHPGGRNSYQGFRVVWSIPV
jgi:formylglycine-generating enzyme required for sulfatase activity